MITSQPAPRQPVPAQTSVAEGSTLRTASTGLQPRHEEHIARSENTSASHLALSQPMQAQNHDKVPNSEPVGVHFPGQDELASFIATVRAGSDQELRHLLNAVQQAAGQNPSQLSSQQRTLLEQIPTGLRQQMGQLTQALQTEAAVRDITNNAMRHPEQMQALLTQVSLLSQNSEGLSTQDMTQRIAAARQQMPPEIRGYFDSLGLNQTANRGLLQTLNTRLAPLQTAYDTHLRGVEPENKALYAERFAAFNTQLLSQAQDLHALDMGQHRDGGARLMLVAQQLDTGSQQLIQSILQHEGPQGPGDFSDFQPQVDLQNGLSAVVLSSFQHLSTQPPAAAEALTQVLSKASNQGAQALSPAEREHLQAIGVGIQAGQLINLVNHQPVGADALEVLTELSQQLRTAQSQGIQEGQLGAASQISTQMQTMLQQTGLANELAAAIEAGNLRLQGLEQEAVQLGTKITSLTESVFRKQAELAATLSQNEALLGALEPFLNADGSLNPAAVLEGTGLGNLNTALQSLGLSVQRTPEGSLGFANQQGEPLEATEFQSLLTQTLRQRQQDQQAQEADLAQTANELELLNQQALTLEANIAQETAAQQGRVQQYREVLATLGDLPLDELAAQLQDPNLRSQLSPADLALLEQRLAEASQHLRNGPTLIQDAEAQINRTQAAGNHLQTQREAAESVLAQAQETLGRAAQVNQRFENTLKSLSQASQTQDQTIANLIQEANRLSFLLNLSPRPPTVDVAQLFSQWQELLQTTSQDFDRQFKQDLNQASQEQQRMDQQAETMRDNLHYHLEKLNALDLRRSDALETMLRQSLETLPG